MWHKKLFFALLIVLFIELRGKEGTGWKNKVMIKSF